MPVKLGIALAVAALWTAACSSSATTTTPPPAATSRATTTTAPTTTATTVAPTTRVPTTTSTTTAPTSMAPASSTTTRSPVATTAPVDVVRSTIEIPIEGRVRTYVLSVPEALSDASPVPLVVDLHGFTADPDTQEDLSSMSAKGAAEGFVVAQPLGLGVVPSWSAGDNAVGDEDVRFLEAVIADAASRVSVDPGRVYASGFSNGGGMANRLACNAAGTFAAIASVAGSYIEHRECDPGRAVPVVAFHGTADFVVDYEGFAILPDVNDWAAAWAARNGCALEPVDSRIAADVILREYEGCDDGASVELYTIEGGGHGWPGTSSRTRFLNSTHSVAATDLIWEFFVTHPLPGR